MAFFSKVEHFYTKWRDIVVTDMMCAFPALIKWFYHKKIKRDILAYQIHDSFGQTCTLFQHGRWSSNPKETTATLILHGLYSHPFVMRHLAEMAQNINAGPVFSLYITYDQENPEAHRSLLRETLNTIETIFAPLKGIVLVGHSMGAIEAAHTAFVENDKRILSVISIAGRLKLVDAIHSPCIEAFKVSLTEIYEGILSMPDLPLYQIVGRYDWNASLESTLVRQDENCSYIVDAMHFNILFHDDMSNKFPEFLQKSLFQTKL